MKLQLGIIYRDGQVTTREDLARLLAAFGRSKAETSGEVFEGSLLMAYRGDRITWEEDNEIQPLKSGPYILTFDGRLDNREEMAERAGMTANRDVPDPVILLKAYRKYGDAIFPDLIGEFALTLWSSQEGRLVFTRSMDGARPLYYVLEKGRLIWASDFAYLVRITDVEPQLNDRYMREYLAGSPSHQHSVQQRECRSARKGHFVQKQHLCGDSYVVEPKQYKAASLQL